jgi:hypothetical protein
VPVNLVKLLRRCVFQFLFGGHYDTFRGSWYMVLNINISLYLT